ncbi:Alpha-ketoglutarate-dependent taurine dioxygenase [Taphrina deformans PYCC 5710]|uniref:Alpha-ketoglutarate-dependent taurine dioxygenase n=1 Tax=Taphrina deformans (strain PYCC 5710 / ATCC 11124 / CBS 356.35 / IMI 108563 / JCM 9778 / NBRC 8474) TaxID=1097556 RepID=R4X732_TAPDE|nr:Alpha-ketoglutarate-dependent taurine dioxygenase [Taphrina deformans PYCC 5710]|eukprot:CCG81077.1 Alpha-ketoglutarate-dependent taurine dioxygenase [Taphrina deformans PYCC 5710]
MAPSLSTTQSTPQQGRKPLYDAEILSRYEPEYDVEVTYPPLEEYNHIDPGHKATGAAIQGAILTELTPSIGTEISGRQVSSFTEAEKNELALLAGQRGLLVFRDQDFAAWAPEKQLEFVQYFGRIHIHPASAHIKGHPEFHIVSRGFDNASAHPTKVPNNANTESYEKSAKIEENTDLGDSISSLAWHSDVSYERQPPGSTFLWILQNPEAGGDTVFASQVEAYNRLSQPFKDRLEGLEVLHSGVEQADNARARGGHVRRAPVEHIHPLVRTHPVTGQKALYVNKQFSRRIIGYKKEESDLLLNFLYDHVAKGVDFQARVKWSPGSVVVWDNRVTVHSALLDFKKTDQRLIARLTPQAEIPFEKE